MIPTYTLLTPTEFINTVKQRLTETWRDLEVNLRWGDVLWAIAPLH